MKKLIQICIVVAFVGLICGRVSGQTTEGKKNKEEGKREIVITVTIKKDSKRSARVCLLWFDITNNAYGTIHEISAFFTGFDDRGREIDRGGWLSTSYNGEYPIALGSTINDIGSVLISEECEYLAEIKLARFPDSYCAMRMLPENVSCSKITILKSNVPSLKIKK